jgi:hypothetical protein
LLTVALPYLRRWLRYVSPLLLFVVLGLAFTGVALHATYDYSSLSPYGGQPAKSADASIAPAQIPQDETIGAPVLEQIEQAPAFSRSPFATEVAQVAILLLAIVVSLRLIVWQANKRRFTPLLYAAIGCGALLGVWLLIDKATFVAMLRP